MKRVGVSIMSRSISSLLGSVAQSRETMCMSLASKGASIYNNIRISDVAGNIRSLTLPYDSVTCEFASRYTDNTSSYERTTDGHVVFQNRFLGYVYAKSLSSVVIKYWNVEVFKQSADKMFAKQGDLASVEFYGSVCPKITSAKSMFYGCETLKKIVFSNDFFKSVTSVDDMFNSCYSLENINGLPGLAVSISLSNTKLSTDSCSKIASSIAYDSSKEEHPVLKIPTSANLSDKDRKIIEDKGWTIVITAS